MSDHNRYLAACHAMQTGVAMKMNYDGMETSPKHLRVGINTAMCDHAALIRLLVAKGLFTLEDYEKEVADEMEREVKRYETTLKGHYGEHVNIHLA